MAKGVLIDGEKLAVLLGPMGSQETVAARIGMKRSGIFRLTRPGVRGMHVDNFNALAAEAKLTFDQLKQRIGASEDAPRMRRVLLDFEPKDHARLKEYANRIGQSLADVALALVLKRIPKAPARYDSVVGGSTKRKAPAPGSDSSAAAKGGTPPPAPPAISDPAEGQGRTK